ncbi:MAG TPA: hypothetical protein VGT05_00500 [Patescibacteria group bacterium]|nr:hypothetical protein [Patescibacteria group bacterium]
MAWLNYAFLTIFFYSLFDVFLKLSSDKMNTWLNAFFLNLVATFVLFVFVVIAYFNGEKIFAVKPGGWFFSLLAGLAISGAGIFFLKMFATGTNLSVGVPLVRVGMVVLGSLLGIFLLKEGYSFKYILGVLFSLVGLFLVIAK